MREAPTSTKGAVVVVGASTGIGKACALRLHQLGFHVFAGVRKPADGDVLKTATNDRLTPVLLDVADETSVARAAETVAAADLGDAGLRGLVNSAGIVVAAPLECVPLAQLRRQFEVNVVGQVAVIQALLPLLRKVQGRIINITSDNGRLALPFIGPYCASKFAMEALSDALRVELHPWGIGVSVVEPGVIATPIWDKSLKASDEMEARLPPLALARELYLYGSATGAFRDAMCRMVSSARPADAVAAVVARALTAPKLKSRYLVGTDARINVALGRYVPDRLRDAVIRWYLGLPRRGPDHE